MIVFEHILPHQEATAVHSSNILDVDWTDLQRRAVRKTTRSGTKVGILLPRNIFFRHDDVLRSREGQLLRINQLTTDVLITAPLEWDQMAALAWTIGNLHLPVEINERQLITVDDGPTESLFVRSDVRFIRATRRFVPLTTRALPGFRLNLQAS